MVFLLLIFFMVSTTFDDKDSLRSPCHRLMERRWLIARSSGVTITSPKLSGQRGKVGSQRQQKPACGPATTGQDKADLPLQIYADANVAYQSVVRVYDVAGQLSFVKLSLTTRQTPDEAQ